MSLRRLMCLGVVCATTPLVLADTRIDYAVEGDGAAVESVLIASGKIRIDQHGVDFWTLYDAGRDALYVINSDSREYWLVDRAQMDRFKE